MKRILIVSAVVVLAGCAATQQTLQPIGAGKFLRFNHVNGDVVTQIDMRSPEHCRLAYDEMIKAAGTGFTWGGAKIGCTAVDSSPLLPVRTTFNDNLMQVPVVFATNTDATCAEWTKLYLNAKMPSSDSSRYSVSAPCSAKR